MYKKLWIKSLALIFICFFALAPFAVSAKTIIEQKLTCQYDITVKIVFDFKDQQVQAISDGLIKTWASGMDKIWNGEYGSKTFGQSCLVNYNFELVKMKDGKTCADYPEFHCFSVTSENLNQRGNIADAAITKANSSMNSWGEWTAKTSALNAAHEVGHMMGLGEEYHYVYENGERRWVNDNYQENNPQSIMAQTWNKVGAFSEHTNQIMSKAGFTPPSAEACPIADQLKETVIQPQEIKTTDINQLKSVDFSASSFSQKLNINRINEQELRGALIKGETDPAVYLVDNQGKLRWLANEQVARKIAGDNWAAQILWFNDSIIYTYQFGERIN